MNSLVGLGAVTSFSAGLSAPLIPGAGLEVSFLEEPVMLLSFVLLGRALEARARLKASGSDFPSITHYLLLLAQSILESSHATIESLVHYEKIHRTKHIALVSSF